MRIENIFNADFGSIAAYILQVLPVKNAFS